MSAKLMALVDGSAYSESVCRHAAWIAMRTEAAVEVYHVLDPRRSRAKRDLSGSIRLGARSDLLQKLSDLDEQHARLAQAQGRAILDDARALIADAGVAEVATRLRSGDIVETVAAIEAEADMLLIGKRGEAAGLESPHLGSNFERIVRATRKPVFVANRAFRPIESVLIAYDNGVSAMKAVDTVARNPLFAGLKVVVVAVGMRSSDLDRALDNAQATLTAGGHDVETHVKSGQPGAVLGEFTESQGVDLLVMGAYGHAQIRTMMLGSTTTELIRTCRVPIVLIR